MDAQRRQVLQMLSEGKITIDEAERLLAALNSDAPAAPGAASPTKPGPRYLRVQVESSDHFGGEGPGKVNLRVPISLLRAGVKLASLVPPSALDRANEALRAQKVPIDLRQLKPQDIE